MKSSGCWEDVSMRCKNVVMNPCCRSQKVCVMLSGPWSAVAVICGQETKKLLLTKMLQPLCKACTLLLVCGRQLYNPLAIIQGIYISCNIHAGLQKTNQPLLCCNQRLICNDKIIILQVEDDKSLLWKGLTGVCGAASSQLQL